MALLLVASIAGCLAEYAVGQSGSPNCPGVDLFTDPDNCGDCGIVCPAETACIAGVCGVECPGGTAVCERTCSDFLDDPRHCGSCDNSCEPGLSCVAGECVDACDAACDPTAELCSDGRCVCRSGFSRCNGVCIDANSHPAECGECSMRCEGGVCANGACALDCPADMTTCPGGSCADLDTSVVHCGECDNPCASDEVCVAGICRSYRVAPCDACPCNDGCGSDKCCAGDGDPLCIDTVQCPS